MARQSRSTARSIPAAWVQRAASYVRVSTEEQAADGYGLDVQRGQALSYAQAFGLEVVDAYADEGISGTKVINDRPGLTQALDDARSGRYDVLIVPAIDRLARRASLLLQIWDELEAVGVAIVAVKERIDTSTPAGRLMRTMFAGVAEFERDSIVARTTAGRNERGRRDGEKGGRLPYGYARRGELVIVDQPAAQVVRRIFNQRAAGATLTAIADGLNAEGIPSPRSGRWYASGVRDVLLNTPAYRGGARNGSPVHWPPIVSKRSGVKRRGGR